MKKLLGILVLGLLWCNTASALPKCEDNDPKKWTNCEGSFDYPDKKYSGEWKDGKRHGQGTLTSPDGAKYVGEWKDGKFHGQGTATYASGSKYVGEFKDGKRHGQGTYTFVDGTVDKGIWENGKLVKPN